MIPAVAEWKAFKLFLQKNKLIYIGTLIVTTDRDKKIFPNKRKCPGKLGQAITTTKVPR